MQVSPFEFDSGSPAEQRTDPPGEPAAPVAMRDAAAGHEEDPRREETPEEPGYGHGV